MRSSTEEPNTHKTSRLSARCRIPACRNMYVTNVHGRSQACAGANPKASAKLGDVNNVLWIRNTSRLATSSRRTQTVKPYIRCGPICSPTCPLVRLVFIPLVQPGCSAPGLQYAHTARERGCPTPGRPEGTTWCGSFRAGSSLLDRRCLLRGSPGRSHLLSRSDPPAGNDPHQFVPSGRAGVGHPLSRAV